MKSDREKVLNSMKRNPGISARELSKNAHVPVAVVRAIMSGGVTAKAETPGKVGKSLSEFRQTYDKDFIVPKQVKEGLKKLGNGWEYEVDFARLIGVRLADLSNYREMFTDYIVPLHAASKRVWAGTVALAKQMREMV